MKTRFFLPLAVAALFLATLHGASAGSISTTTIDGETVVKWNGKEVFKGKVAGPAHSKSSTIDGKELAAIFSGDKVIWESEPGAAAAITAAEPAIKLPPVKERDKGIQVASVDGESVVTYKGKEVWKGKAMKGVSAKSKTVDGKEYAAAFDGDRLLWENVPGAAGMFGKSARKPETA